MENINKIWDFLLENELFTENEMQLITNMNGYNFNTFNDAMYCRYGEYLDIEEIERGY